LGYVYADSVILELIFVHCCETGTNQDERTDEGLHRKNGCFTQEDESKYRSGAEIKR
jgi:hypothetical protein